MAVNKTMKTAIAISTAVIAMLGLIIAVPAFSIQAAATSNDQSTSTSSLAGIDASSPNKDFYIFTSEIEGVNETKLGLSGDVYSLQTMVVNQGDHVTVHFYNLETDQNERHSFTIGAPYNINKDLAGGENTTVSFVADHKGVFQYFCIHHQPEMRGQLVVLPSVTHKVSTNIQVEIEPQVTKIVNHITTVSPQINIINIKQVINQLAIQVVNLGGNGSLVVNQVADQVATENGNGNVSQFVKQLAQQEASGNTQSVNQTITQIAKQVANGNEGNVVQVIKQTSVQGATTTTATNPLPNSNATIAQTTNQTANQTALVNGGNQANTGTVNTTTTSTNGTNNTTTSSSNPLDYLRNLFGIK